MRLVVTAEIVPPVFQHSKKPKILFQGFAETDQPFIFAVPFKGKAQNQRILEGFEDLNNSEPRVLRRFGAQRSLSE
jgi:hypothetical protein